MLHRLLLVSGPHFENQWARESCMYMSMRMCVCACACVYVSAPFWKGKFPVPGSCSHPQEFPEWADCASWPSAACIFFSFFLVLLFPPPHSERETVLTCQRPENECSLFLLKTNSTCWKGRSRDKDIEILSFREKTPEWMGGVGGLVCFKKDVKT